jgi:hypothetical protein
MFGLKRVGSTIVRDEGGAVIMLMGQSSFSLGLEWTGFHTPCDQSCHLKLGSKT